MTGIGVEEFDVVAVAGDTDAVGVTGLGGEVADEDHEIIWVLGAAEKGDDGGIDIAEIDPLEAVKTGVDLVEGGFGLVKPVQLRD